MENNGKIQKILNKFISEEKIATDLYRGCLASVKRDQLNIIHDLFHEIAEDEYHDHHKALIKFARANEYNIVFKYKDLEKYASENTVKQFNNIKKDQNAGYYINEAIKSEQQAIDDYAEVLGLDKAKDPDMPYDLYAILMKNYYDECEHLSKLSTLQYANDASVLIKL